jgi:uncharacterized protein YxjI
MCAFNLDLRVMKKITSACLLFLSCFTNAYALSVDELPNEMYLTQHWISHTTSFDIETKTQKIGTLYRRFFSIPLHYDFYDYHNNLLTTARARFFSIGAHFDVYDADKRTLGSVEEKIFTFFPTFTIYSPDGVKLAHAESNFWGTQFTVYDALTDKSIATMSRPFFRIKNDWTLTLKHKNLITERNLDPSLLLTVLAFQGDREYWEQQHQQDDIAQGYYYSRQLSHLDSKPQDKITACLSDMDLNHIPLLKQPELETLMVSLEQDYQVQISPALIPTNTQAKVNSFVDFCLDRVNDEQTTPSTKKAILYLLKQRFNGLLDTQ